MRSAYCLELSDKYGNPSDLFHPNQPTSLSANSWAAQKQRFQHCVVLSVHKIIPKTAFTSSSFSWAELPALWCCLVKLNQFYWLSPICWLTLLRETLSVNLFVVLEALFSRKLFVNWPQSILKQQHFCFRFLDQPEIPYSLGEVDEKITEQDDEV